MSAIPPPAVNPSAVRVFSAPAEKLYITYSAPDVRFCSTVIGLPSYGPRLFPTSRTTCRSKASCWANIMSSTRGTSAFGSNALPSSLAL